MVPASKTILLLTILALCHGLIKAQDDEYFYDENAEIDPSVKFQPTKSTTSTTTTTIATTTEKTTTTTTEIAQVVKAEPEDNYDKSVQIKEDKPAISDSDSYDADYDKTEDSNLDDAAEEEDDAAEAEEQATSSTVGKLVESTIVKKDDSYEYDNDKTDSVEQEEEKKDDDKAEDEDEEKKEDVKEDTKEEILQTRNQANIEKNKIMNANQVKDHENVKQENYKINLNLVYVVVPVASLVLVALLASTIILLAKKTSVFKKRSQPEGADRKQIYTSVSQTEKV